VRVLVEGRGIKRDQKGNGEKDWAEIIYMVTVILMKKVITNIT
jgi:hypothetical protein